MRARRLLWFAPGMFVMALIGCSSNKELLAQREAEIGELQGHIGTMQTRMSELEREHAEAVSRAEQLEAELREMADKEKIQMERMEQMTVLRLSDNMLFGLGKAEVTDEGRRVLDRIGEIVARYPGHDIRVEGHTDDTPIKTSALDRYPSNWELSTARATNVVRYLVKKYKISPARLVAVGYGEYRPIAGNDTPANRARNRRVEFHIAMPRPVKELTP